MSLHKAADRLVRARFEAMPELGERQLAESLRILAKWRHQLIANTIVARDGAVVKAGPFQGQILGAEGTEGGHAPRLLGCYEQELHATLERLIAQGFTRVVNIGCADGYYAVGLARRMPGAVVHAHDIDPKAQAACRRMAEANGVGARVVVGGEVDHAVLAQLAAPGSWVLCDIEGAEDALLDPVAVPELAACTILVECHEGPRPGITQRMAARFAPTHKVTRVDQGVHAATLPGWMAGLSHLDQLLATWEWREQPTPWLVLEPA
jgi:predicted O-methyltransferase YrrM